MITTDINPCNPALQKLYKNTFRPVLWTAQLTASTGSNETTCYEKTGIFGNLQRRWEDINLSIKRSKTRLNRATYFHSPANELYLWILF